MALCLHKQIYLNLKSPLSFVPSFQNHFQSSCEEYLLDATVQIIQDTAKSHKICSLHKNGLISKYFLQWSNTITKSMTRHHTLNICCRALISGSGIYMRLSKRLLMACAHYWLWTVPNRLDDSKLNAKNNLRTPSPDLEHMEYLLLQEQEPSDRCSLHPIYQEDKVSLLHNKNWKYGFTNCYSDFTLPSWIQGNNTY